MSDTRRNVVKWTKEKGNTGRLTAAAREVPARLMREQPAAKTFGNRPKHRTSRTLPNSGQMPDYTIGTRYFVKDSLFVVMDDLGEEVVIGRMINYRNGKPTFFFTTVMERMHTYSRSRRPDNIGKVVRLKKNNMTTEELKKKLAQYT